MARSPEGEGERRLAAREAPDSLRDSGEDWHLGVLTLDLREEEEGLAEEEEAPIEGELRLAREEAPELPRGAEGERRSEVLTLELREEGDEGLAVLTSPLEE